jgi:bifunctional UDP-N-acetylglucosamine pyrophosphorylase/glucosamine-1-phosphate N-acetyltransferase
MGNDVVLGVFTELKNTSLADGVRARHHSYLGDAIIGRDVNVGAGSITANFDGENVNQTTVGDGCYIGSGTVLIAPLVLPAGANVGAGLVVSQQNVSQVNGKPGQ